MISYRSICWNCCGGTTGKKYERTKSRYKTTIRSWRTPWSQDTKMESKNENTFLEKNSIHIIDLTQTVEFIKNALVQVHKVISSGGKLLVVSTKKQASEQISDLAKETGQFYVNYRWLGGMLTNWNTIQNSIKRLKKLNEQLSKENLGFTKKEILKFGKEKDKLQRSLGGIAEMKKLLT